MQKEIKILQFSRRFDICSFIKEAMKKTHPELLEQTQFYNNLSDAKKTIITPKKVLSREGKPMLIVTGSVLLDENGNRIIKKILKWNPKAEFIVFSNNIESISSKKLIKKIEKHNTPECYEALIKEIYEIVSQGKE